MKVKLREDVYISTPTEYSTCVNCVFISNDGVKCDAPDFLYSCCVDCNQIFSHSQTFFKIFEL